MKTYRWTEEQKKALRGSIRKWTKIVNGTGSDEGQDNCQCCKKWAENTFCDGCPIKEFTGLSGCEGTPYDLYEDWVGSDLFYYKEDAAMAELNFLKAVYLAGGGK